MSFKKLILNPSVNVIFHLHVFVSHHVQCTSPLGSFRQQKLVRITTKYRVMVLNITGIQLN